MSVSYHGEVFEEEESDTDGGVETHTRVFLLLGTSKTDRTYTAGSNANLPRIGSRHPSNSNARCIKLSVRHAKGLWFKVVAEYSTAFQIEENPLLQPAEIEWDGENWEETLYQDTSGDAILNSAGDPFTDVFRERTRRVVKIVKNIGSVPLWIITAEDAVNSSAFVVDGFSVGTGLARLAAPRLGPWQTRNNVRFRQMTMIMKLSKDGWTSKPLDAGYRYRNGSSQLVKATNPGDGTDVSQPVPLNGSGGLLTNPTPATAVFGSYTVYPSYNFNLLPLT